MTLTTDITVALIDGDDALQQEIEDAGGRVSRFTSDQLIALGGALVPPPSAFIIDTRLTPLQPAAVAAARRRHPGAALLMVAPRLDPIVLLEGMRAGVTEALADPVTAADLAAALTRAVAQTPGAAGRIFVVVGAKGGVGATTVAVNLAVALRQLSKTDVLLIDLHLANGDAHIFLGVEPRYSVVDALKNSDRLDQTLLASLVARASAIDLLASPQAVSRDSIAARQIQALLAVAASRYPYTVVDASRCDGLVLATLDSVTRILVVTDQALTVVRSASRVVASLREQYGDDRVGVVVAREDRRSAIGVGDVERAVAARVVATLPSHYRAAISALDAGQPAALDPRSDLGRAFERLAAAVSGIERARGRRSPVLRRSARRARETA